jgi:GTP-binding protein
MSESTPSTEPLVIRSLEFIGPMAEAGGWRPESELPEIAFVGRSNVGKSSLLNKLVRRKAFARVSNTPGRTREINFFKVNGTFVLADLPGYGYARISKARKEAWKPLIEGFLRFSPMLRGVVQLIDVRHEPTQDDRYMLDFLADLGVPTLVVFTKIDKLKFRERAVQVPALLASLGLDEEQALLFSARTGEGRDDLASAVVSLCEAPAWRTAEEAAEQQVKAEIAAAAKAERDLARKQERAEYRR